MKKPVYKYPLFWVACAIVGWFALAMLVGPVNTSTPLQTELEAVMEQVECKVEWHKGKPDNKGLVIPLGKVTVANNSPKDVKNVVVHVQFYDAEGKRLESVERELNVFLNNMPVPKGTTVTTEEMNFGRVDSSAQSAKVTIVRLEL